jgi:enoyl-CoA hydratase
MTDASTVRIDRRPPIVVVTIDRPEVRNAVDRPTAAALADAFRAFDEDDALRSLTGAAIESSTAETARWGPHG